MKRGPRSLGESLRAEDYGWLESRMRFSTPAAPAPRHEETVSIIVEDDLLRTVLYTILFGGLASLLAYFSFCVASGEGRRIFPLTATLAAFLACGAAAAQRRKWLRFVLVLGSLCAFALLVDQLVYYHWHKRVDRLVATLQQDIGAGSSAFPLSMKLRPTSFRIDPGQEIVLRFEPPLLAWTYHLDSASPLGHTLIAGWYEILSRVTRGRDLDSVSRTIVHPHEAYSVGVKSDVRTLACQEGEKGRWTLSIDTRPADRPL